MAKVPDSPKLAGRSPIVEMDNRDSDFIPDLRFFNSLLEWVDTLCLRGRGGSTARL